MLLRLSAACLLLCCMVQCAAVTSARGGRRKSLLESKLLDPNMKSWWDWAIDTVETVYAAVTDECGVTCSGGYGVNVNTQWGPIRGHVVDLFNGKQVDSFLGVPFAAPPVGDLRFRPPQDPTQWTEVFEAERLRSACTQEGGIFDWTHPEWSDIDEDCLNMNIYAPHDKSGGPYAVMVYFHGGAYTGGANIQFPGHFLAMRDVVVVVPNYRLNHLGFMSTGDANGWGNWAMHDQVKVLQFVRDNIALFGGDPNCVTLFGQSAGGSSASLHMFSPLSVGLFHRAITQSGTDMSAWAVNWPNQNPDNYTRQVAEKANCTTTDSAAMMDCLRQIPADELTRINFFCKDGYFCQGFAPVIDHAGGFLPELPHLLRESGNFQQVDLMSGILSEDGSPYTISFMPETVVGGLNRTEFLDLIRNRLVRYFSARLPGQLYDDVYESMAFYYSPWPHIHDEERNRRMMNNLTTDVGFGTPLDAQVKDHVRYNPNTYMYVMGFRTDNWIELFPEWMGVPHQGDLPYVIGYPFLKLDDNVRNDSGIYFDAIDWMEDDREYAEFVQTMWTNFAKTGNPTSTPVERPFGGGPFTWESFGNEMKYISMYREVSMQVEYRQKNHAFWQQYMPYVSKIDPLPVEQVPDGDTDEEPFRLKSDEVQNAILDFWSDAIADRLEH